MIVDTYAWQVKGGSELAAQRIITEHGGIGMIPVEYRIIRTNPKTGTHTVRSVPRLHGYYFGMFLDTPKWHVLADLRHPTGERVLGKPLSPDGSPRPLDALTRLQIYSLRGNDLNPEIAASGKAKPGDTAIIQDGPHAGKRVKVKRHAKADNGVLLVQTVMLMLGELRTVDIEVAEVSLELVEAA